MVSTTAGRCWNCSSLLKCAQQLCSFHNNHCAFSIWNNIFPGHRFFSSMKYLTSYFWLSGSNWKFHNKGKIFSHPSLPFINLNHSHWLPFWRPNRRRWGQLAVALLRCTSHFMWKLRTTGTKMLYRLRHEASFSQISTRGFCGCVESLAVTKHQARIPQTRRQNRVLAARAVREGAPDLTVPMPILAYAGASIKIDDLCIGQCWYLGLYWSVLDCIGIVLVNIFASLLAQIGKKRYAFGLYLHISLFHTYQIPTQNMPYAGM